jgi:hypothetical protein
MLTAELTPSVERTELVGSMVWLVGQPLRRPKIYLATPFDVIRLIVSGFTSDKCIDGPILLL